MPQPLSADVSGILEAHLDAVESALATAGQPRGTRKAIVDDLEAQILDMLTESTGARPATVADMEAILAKLDPPQAYATGRPLPVPPRPRRQDKVAPGLAARPGPDVPDGLRRGTDNVAEFFRFPEPTTGGGSDHAAKGPYKYLFQRWRDHR